MAFAGLFRSNSGVFTFVAGVVLIVTVSGGPREKALRIAAFAGIIFLCAMPWLGWIAAKKKLLAYLVHLSVVRFRISPGARHRRRHARYAASAICSDGRAPELSGCRPAREGCRAERWR